MSANSPRFCRIELTLRPSAGVSPFCQAISCPPAKPSTSVITTATATGADHLAERARVERETEVEEEERGEDVAQRQRELLDAIAVPGRAEHEADQERADRIRDPEELADAAERDSQAEEQDREELVVLGLDQARDHLAAPAGEREHADEEGERDPELQDDGPTGRSRR